MFLWQGKMWGVQKSSVWAHMSPLLFHKGDEANNDLVNIQRGASECLFGQYSDYGRQQRFNTGTDTSGCSDFGGS